ncbi:hypothetical protein TPHA_0E01900 [Tetrapisispora phaffii CBS 4417]|uniref:Non-specific serine/threonine protein kinase n=1 Tax=Tetrapisispora phaffii (strain ATCC 24235 / CBS 4417 / NBRC 1672 / NRRL Y-8282 / UCD 70-5) TaxID=1071381 RepID=G8BTQ5_TETPH|nr:hypothetical protein TPHA_0E01900 [Tetrapisispora phaffii CBS 4417]CCE63283.1 hypothetical protein TPHA_0E01900 [Tetrapisispora phaffii CBS 4417]
MSFAEHIDHFVSLCNDENATLQSKHTELSEVCDAIELLNSQDDYEGFLKAVIPVLLKELNTVSCNFNTASAEHKFRNSILDILNRCPMNELFEPHVDVVLDSLIKILPEENEENGVLCMKVLTALFKSYKHILQDKVPLFIDIISKVYKDTPQLVLDIFSEEKEDDNMLELEENPDDNLLEDSSIYSQSNSLTDDNKGDSFDAVTNSKAQSSMHSFKILAECPITMVTLYSSYRQLTSVSLPEFTPLVMDLLNIQIEQQKKSREEAEANGKRFISVSPNIKNRPAFFDFILAQIKAISFLAYIFIRGYAPNFLQNYVEQVPDLIIRLLQDCPSKLSSARKELLHATRHILSTNYKSLFLPKLHDLFDESVLIGTGFTTHETLRPLAYSTIADFIHNIRAELQLNDIEKTIKKYTNYMLDPTLALTVQIMSAKLLLNLVERILKLGKENPQEAQRAKKLLMTIIDAYTKRCHMINMKYDSILKSSEEYEQKKREKAKELQNSAFNDNSYSKEFMDKLFLIEDSNNNESDQSDDKNKTEDNEDESFKNEGNEKEDVVFNKFDLKSYTPIQIVPDSTNDPIKDAFYLYRTLMSFLKTIIHDLKVFNPPYNEYTAANPKLWASVSRGFSYEEVLVFKNLFHECIIGLKFFSVLIKNLISHEKHFDITMPSLPVSATKDGRELMDYLAIMFIQLDSSTFNEIIESEIEFMYESMLNDSALLYVAQSFLTSETTSPNFAGILLRFLKKNLKDLGNIDFNESNILIRLFKLSFMSVNLFPNINEIVLLPHLNDLILDSIKFSTTAEEPIVYFYLIRTLFRSIGGGRFENLYRSIKPILQHLLQALNDMIVTARLPHERELYVELCITVPVRLSVLAPYLPYLMKPLVYALQGYPDLISQGLRTLELCIDNLTAEYFDPIIEPVIEDIMASLFSLLKPQPFNHTISHTTVRILGKLGGRNRRLLKDTSNLKSKDEYDSEIEALFSVNGMVEDIPFSITPGVKSAINILQDDRVDIHYKKSAYKYVSSVLLLMIKSSTVFPDNYSGIIETITKSSFFEDIEQPPNFELEPLIDEVEFSKQEELFVKLLEGLFFATSIPDVKEEATNVLNLLTDHFCLLQLNRTLSDKRRFSTVFNVDMKQPKIRINPNVLTKALLFALSYYISDVRETGLKIIERIYTQSKIIYTEEYYLSHSFVYELLKQFIHHCYEEAYYDKNAGVLGIKALCENLHVPVDFLEKYRFELVDALLFVLKDTPYEAPTAIVKTAENLIIDILSTTCKNITESDLSMKSLQNTLTDIVCELSNANVRVRKACQDFLSVISELSNIPIVKLMDHSKNFLLSPIFTKPLRALPFSMQIGNVSAVTYYLELPDTFLSFDEELFRLLQETIVLADAEDESLSTMQRVSEYKTSEQLVQLRVACVKLLAAALKNEKIATSQQGNVRIRILAVFFKCMLKSSPEIIDTTYDALKGVLSENSKLPKELLQNGLKPMLMNLSDHQKLTVHGLESLARLLEILIAYFKVEIGKKLLDHLTAWCKCEVLDTIFGQDITDQMPTKIISSIVNIFHLLPAQADMFLNELLLKVMLLERRLRLQLNSPFRTPLAKYMNRFHETVTEYFKKNMGLRQLVLMMCSILKRPEAHDLADDFERELDNFYEYYLTNIPNNQVRVVSFFTNMVDLVVTISDIRGKGWLKDKGDLIVKLKKLFELTLKTIKQNSFYIDNLQLNQAIEKLQLLYVQYMEFHMDKKELLFDFIEFSYSNEFALSSHIEDFIFSRIVKCDNVEEQNAYLNDALQFALSDRNIDAGIFILKNIVNASFIYESRKSGNIEKYFVEGQKPEWYSQIESKVWKSSNTVLLSNLAGQHDIYRFELLQISTAFIKWAPDTISDIKMDVIKFIWHFIKVEDTLIKESAYLVISHFICKFDLPVKVVTQVFVAILRCTQSEARYLVRQSLDILAPIIHRRMIEEGTPGVWITWVKRVIFENNSNQNNALYKFLINHHGLFYDLRELFILNIIHHMNKITFIPNPNPESHTLAIDLVAMILKWEEHTNELRSKKVAIMEKESNIKTDAEGDVEMDDMITSENVTSINDYIIPTHVREMYVAFLIRYICASNHRASESELGLKAICVLSSLLSKDHWNDVTVKLNYFEKFFNYQDPSSENMVHYSMNALDVIYILFTNRSPEWIMENLATIQKLLDKCIRADHHDIQKVVQKVINLILKAIKVKEVIIDTEEETVGKTFVNTLVSIIDQDLQGTSSVVAGVMLEWTLFMNFPQKVDSLLGSTMKTFSKLCKDHLSTSQPKDAAAIEEARITTKLLEKVLCLLSKKVSNLGDSRRPFLSTVALLIDRSMNQNFLRKIIVIAKKWVFNNDLFPTVKEKAAILTKMLAFEVRGEPSLSKMFYEIILELFDKSNFNNTEITVRMEQPFLVGTRVQEVTIRKKFMEILDNSIERDIKERLYYIIRDQNWEFIADYPWLNQALQLLFGALDPDYELNLSKSFSLPVPTELQDYSRSNIVIPEKASNTTLVEFIDGHIPKIKQLCDIKSKDIISPLIEIFYQDSSTIHNTWVDVFPKIYTCIPRNEKYGFVRSLISLLSKDYHTKQLSSRTNVITMLLDSISRVDSLELPPHLVKYLALSYNSWYQSIKILEGIQDSSTIDNTKIIEANEDALLELYQNLQEDDMFYGLWRRRAKYTETNIALSYEQLGMWDKAQQVYELAQVKARSGSLPYSESEYAVWEDNWVMCAEKLQHWDILTELAKHEGFTDLLLECGWRVADWNADKEALEQSVKSVMDVPTPRRQMFETFLSLQDFANKKTGDHEVRRLCDEGIQLSLQKWTSLPERFTPSHKWLLHGFQQYIEFLEATQLYTNLHSTTIQNLDSKGQEIKRVLQAWRDRLPNITDDVNMWNDLVTWRQHAFNVVNAAYLPLIPALQQASGNNNINTHAYRGYHEIAWVINRFAHVARRHNMPKVCVNQLARIYTLPNIEIQEAFLKLREQAKCHYQNLTELTTGLDVISNTNLVYFGTVQKAEFFTLKGMFLSKLRANEEANQAFATAVQIDLNLAKAWAQWGVFNDKRLSEEPTNINYASNAISCYLQAAGLYKKAKTRRLLCRILWLISLDDTSGALSNAFDSFRGEVPVWYWITFIPQLLTSLSHKEANMVRQILIRVAKSYPQALHFQLRTTKEDFAVIQRQSQAVMADKSNPKAQSPNEQISRQPWEYLQELNNILKTAYPLLALSLESLVAQINDRFKTTTDEDLFRLINVLLFDATFNYNHLPLPRGNPKLPSNTEDNLVRFSETLLSAHIRPKFNADFIDSKPDFETYIKRLRYWRRRIENKLDRVPRVEYLERLCPHLSNFHHQKFEDIEVPGQYLLNKDNNAHFTKIVKFLPEVDFVRTTHSSYRRITIRGHDGSLHTFAVQYPAVRHSRREERMFQLFRLFNKTLDKNVETGRRNCNFTLPIAVPLSPQVRLMNDSPSFVTMHQIYDHHCAKNNTEPDAIQDYVLEQLDFAHDKALPTPDITAVKVEIFSSIQSMFMPTTVLKNYFSSLYTQFEEFWLFRKQFTSHYASFIFMTYMMMINNRTPHKIYVDKKSGNVFTLEMLPSRYPFERIKPYMPNSDIKLPNDAPIFHNNEPVPFRLTPNIQKLIGDSGLEGVLSVNIFAISKALMEPENELNTYLTLFIRDEIISWYSNLHRPIVENPQLHEMVQTNVDLIIRKVAQLSHIGSAPLVTTQFILDCISSAVNPRNLAKTDIVYIPWF